MPEMGENVEVEVSGAPFWGVVEEAPSLLEHETVNREFTPRTGISFTRLVRIGESREYITHETYQGVMASRLLLYVGFGARPHPNGVRLPHGVEEGRDYLLLVEEGDWQPAVGYSWEESYTDFKVIIPLDEL